MSRPISCVLVANRGEIARRVFRTCRELGIEAVAVFSDPDRSAPFVAEADVAVRLPGSSPTETYLRGDLVIAAALKAGADAIHPGYGFLSENAQFARDVAAAGLTWIGPTPEAIEAMGDKIRAKELMAGAGVPQLGGLEPEAITAADLPVLVKASAGGGGRGMRIVGHLDELDASIRQASAEAASAFGDPAVFVEPYLQDARHVEVQVLGDTHGTVWIVGDRDCSIQRRHQKVVEEAPAPGLSDAVRATLHDAARAAAKAVDYVGAGTVEFMVADDRVFFLEMNTRLQVEHPVTEEVFGLDLVAHQIAVAEGRALAGDVPEPNGHAVEVRLYAEDPAEDWQPQTGTIRTFDVPLGPGVRVDSGVEAGSVVGIHYDAMIAKIVAHGPDRSAAIRRLRDVLRRTRVHGLSTNLDFLRAILADDDVAGARLRTTLLDDRLAAWTAPRLDEPAHRRLALAAALAEATTATTGAKVLSRIPAAYRNVPSQPRTRSYKPVVEVRSEAEPRNPWVEVRSEAEPRNPWVEVRSEAEPRNLTVSYSAGFVQHDLDGVTVVEAGPTRVVLDVDGVTETYDVVVGDGWVDVDGPHGSVDLTPVPTFVDPADVVAAGSLLAPMPTAVVSVAVTQGQQVAKGDVIVVLEAMKMQHTITAPTDGVVTQLTVAAGSQVESGAVLAQIDIADIVAAGSEGEMS